MKKIFSLLGIIALTSAPVWADDVGTLGSVDEIDHVFTLGAPVGTATFSDGADDDWMVFDAVAGQVFDITLSSDDGNCVNYVVLLEETNGIVEIGDSANVTDFNDNHTGDGEDLVIVIHDENDDSFNNSEVEYVFNATSTGQHVLGFKGCNDSASGTTITVRLTARGAEQVPTMSQWALYMMTLLLAGIGATAVYRRRGNHA